MSAARPETGATDADIEAAAKRYWAKTSNMPWADMHELHRAVVVKKITAAAEMIVPPTHVIALAEHVVSAADREAIGRAEYAIAARKKYHQVLDEDAGDYEELDRLAEAMNKGLDAVTTDDLARLERLRGSGGEETT